MMFSVALFTSVMEKSIEPSKYLSIEEWKEKIWYIYTIELYAVIKKNKTMLSIGKYNQLEIIILCKTVRPRKTNIIISLICSP